MAEKLKRVAIIGGGYAGLAAAVTLAQQNIPVTLFEAGKTLGGRARGMSYRGVSMDNGQHILLGAYRETLRLMALAGTRHDAVLRLPLALSIPGHFALKTPALPAPLHLVSGLLLARGLPLGERLAAIRFAVSLRLKNFRLPQDTSVASLLALYHQEGEIGRLLWEPLCLAALNTPIEQASAQVFLNVLRDSFSRARSDSDVVLPRADLSALFPLAAGEFICKHGGRVLTGSRIRSIERDDENFILGREGGTENFSHVICATAPQHALTLLSGLPETAPAIKMLNGFAYQPIATIYLQYPHDTRLPAPMLGLTGGFAQWVFDRGHTHGTPGLLAVVISAEGEHQDWPAEQLAGKIHLELQRAFALPPPLWHKAIIERRATFACTVGLKRPPQATGLKNFYLAGDYTAGDYPATIEGAVRSGAKAAALISATINPVISS
ncbi:MAG: desaturase [Nitrosomonadales bacterium]|nr:MAG: desaturase [Nitrosomonadales bacterium]